MTQRPQGSYPPPPGNHPPGPAYGPQAGQAPHGGYAPQPGHVQHAGYVMPPNSGAQLGVQSGPAAYGPTRSSNGDGDAAKIILMVFGGLALAGVGTCAVCSLAVGHAVDAAEAQEEVAATTASECASAEAVPWSSLAKRLDDNEAKVVAEWKSSCVKVRGVVQSISSGYDDEATVVIGNGDEFSFHNLHCEPKEHERALELKKGQRITVWGTGGDELLGSLILDHCDW